MAELVSKLHIKKNGVQDDCCCYSTIEEATPITVTGGSALRVKSAGVVGYVGLWPITEAGGQHHTMLRHKKDGITYYVERKVANNCQVKIAQSANQTIKVTYNGEVYTESFSTPVGAYITVTVTPATGYTAGAPSISSGYVNEDITITASPASKATYLVTIVQTDGQTIEVTCNGLVFTSNFTADHGDTWTASVIPDSDYRAGTLNASSGVISGPITISATAAEYLKKVITIIQPDGGRIIATPIATGEGYTQSFAVAPETAVRFECVANSDRCFDAWQPVGEFDWNIPIEDTLVYSKCYQNFTHGTNSSDWFWASNLVVPTGANVLKIVVTRTVAPVAITFKTRRQGVLSGDTFEREYVIGAGITQVTIYMSVAAGEYWDSKIVLAYNGGSQYTTRIDVNAYMSRVINKHELGVF